LVPIYSVAMDKMTFVTLQMIHNLEGRLGDNQTPD
jgi:hypothetical protein